MSSRELVIINVGGDGKVEGVVFEVRYKEALHIGKDAKEVYFTSNDANNPSKF